MPLKARVLVRVGCSECHEHYEVSLSLQAVVAVAAGTLDAAPLPAPEGWRARGGGAFCPNHVPAGKEDPTPEVLKRALALQALARNESATEGERRNAWSQFEKLWQRYDLPGDLGL